jgi:hypothetical protein
VIAQLWLREHPLHPEIGNRRNEVVRNFVEVRFDRQGPPIIAFMRSQESDPLPVAAARRPLLKVGALGRPQVCGELNFESVRIRRTLQINNRPARRSGCVVTTARSFEPEQSHCWRNACVEHGSVKILRQRQPDLLSSSCLAFLPSQLLQLIVAQRKTTVNDRDDRLDLRRGHGRSRWTRHAATIPKSPPPTRP